ncbi:TonB family protein [Pontibacter sp. Tf4]|uniref:TonB family protein n=1 Tax=Pontibacter sp. Tf4 TaxID=2761620 RepID=UPI0016274B11|nr:TonB family protein [Pontibacter sp. Tf4]MBB6611161.1 TonB family protein [Pontibacter sp. Tf4]
MKHVHLTKTLLATPLVAFALTVMLPAPTIAQTKQENKTFTYVEQMPVYKGGEKEMMKFLAANISYPAEAKAKGVEGLTVVSFVIDETGHVKDAKVLKGLGHGTDQEALRVVNLTNGNWTPGKQNGKVVSVQYTLPIRFTLNESDRAASASVANQPPKFKGGNEALYTTMLAHLQLPEEAKKENLNARVIVKFNVEKDGTVSNIRLQETKLKKTVGAGADMDYMDASTFQVQNKAVLARLAEAATAAVKATSGKWEPALQNGQPTGSELVLPIQFLGEAAGNNKQLASPEMSKYTKDYYKLEEVSVQPTFKEGAVEKFMAKNLRYPAGLHFEGTVEMGIVIKADGAIVGPMFYRGESTLPKSKEENAALHNELIRVVKLMEGKWEPAKVDGKPVTVTRKLTIQFVLNDGTKKAADTSGTKADVIVTKIK